MSKGTEPIRIEKMFGMVHEHAELLATMATATGRQVVEEFNGIDLIANPAEEVGDIMRRYWADRREALRNEVSS